MASKGVSRIEHAILGQIQMVFPDKFSHVSGTQMLLLRTEGILQIESINTQLVRHHHIHLIRHFSRNPVMSSNGLQPPDFVLILERNAVHFISSVLLQQTSQTLHTFPCAVNVGKYQIYNIFLTDAAFYQRICS